MKQNFQILFICLTLITLPLQANQICKDYDSQGSSYAKVALYLTNKYYQNDLENSVVQIFDLTKQDAKDAGVNQDDIDNNRFSFNVYKFTNDQGHQEKKKQLEANLRYMLFFRGSFEYKYLSDNGCFIKQEEDAQYIILQFPGERIQVNDWFGEFYINQNTKLTFLQITQEQLKQSFGNNSNYQRKAVGFNPFFSMDISLQFLIAVAKMHEKNILHLNLKPFNLKLLNRFCLALDNFESSLYSTNGNFESFQQFSETNPYNGQNVADKDKHNFNFTDDLHSAGLVIYQLCTFRTLENSQLFAEVKNGFNGLNDIVTNQTLFDQTKQWCGKIVYNLLNSNGRLTEENLSNFEIDEDDKQQLNNGKDAIEYLIQIMIEMRKENQEQFQEYYQNKLQYLQGQNLSQSTLDFKQQIELQTNLVQQIVSQDQIDTDKVDQLLNDSSLNSKITSNNFIVLPVDDKILDPNQQLEIPSELQQIPSECQDQENDFSIQCLDKLLTIQIAQNQSNIQVQQVFQQKDYENGMILQKLDDNIGGYGYDMNIFQAQENKKTDNLDHFYLMV